ncbi:MAG: hypothetical protein RIC03_16570 [Cyclobacteriaceae bacterium]
MDEIKSAWNDLNAAKNNFSSSTDLEIHEIIQAKSKGAIQKIKEQVYLKFWFCVFFLALLGIYLPFANPFISQVLISVMVVAYTIGSIFLFKEYKSLKKTMDMSQNLLDGLKNYRKKILQIIKYEEIIALILYPISAPAGFFVGLKFQNADIPILESKEQWVALILCIVIITPAAHFTTKWMNRKAFGKYLEQIEENIQILEKE